MCAVGLLLPHGMIPGWLGRILLLLLLLLLCPLSTASTILTCRQALLLSDGNDNELMDRYPEYTTFLRYMSLHVTATSTDITNATTTLKSKLKFEDLPNKLQTHFWVYSTSGSSGDWHSREGEGHIDIAAPNDEDTDFLEEFCEQTKALLKGIKPLDVEYFHVDRDDTGRHVIREGHDDNGGESMGTGLGNKQLRRRQRQLSAPTVEGCLNFVEFSDGNKRGSLSQEEFKTLVNILTPSYNADEFDHLPLSVQGVFDNLASGEDQQVHYSHHPEHNLNRWRSGPSNLFQRGSQQSPTSRSDINTAVTLVPADTICSQVRTTMNQLQAETSMRQQRDKFEKCNNENSRLFDKNGDGLSSDEFAIFVHAIAFSPGTGATSGQQSVPFLELPDAVQDIFLIEAIQELSPLGDKTLPDDLLSQHKTALTVSFTKICSKATKIVSVMNEENGAIMRNQGMVDSLMQEDNQPPAQPPTNSSLSNATIPPSNNFTNNATNDPLSEVTIAPTSDNRTIAPSDTTIVPSSDVTMDPSNDVTLDPSINSTVAPSSNSSNLTFAPSSNRTVAPSSNSSELTFAPSSNSSNLTLAPSSNSSNPTWAPSNNSSNPTAAPSSNSSNNTMTPSSNFTSSPTPGGNTTSIPSNTLVPSAPRPTSANTSVPQTLAPAISPPLTQPPVSVAPTTFPPMANTTAPVTTTPTSLPQPMPAPGPAQIATVFNAWVMSNAIGKTASDLRADTTSFSGIQRAYDAFTLDIEAGMSLSRATRSRLRRRLTVSLQPGTSNVYYLVDSKCPSAVEVNENCLVAYGTVNLLVEGESAASVAIEYETLSQSEIAAGALQVQLNAADPGSLWKVEGSHEPLTPEEGLPTPPDDEDTGDRGGSNLYTGLIISGSIALLLVILIYMFVILPYMRKKREVEKAKKEALAALREAELAHAAAVRKRDELNNKKDEPSSGPPWPKTDHDETDNPYREQVERLMDEECPDLLDDLDSLLHQFRGREEELIAHLRNLADVESILEADSEVGVECDESESELESVPNDPTVVEDVPVAEVDVSRIGDADSDNGQNDEWESDSSESKVDEVQALEPPELRKESLEPPGKEFFEEEKKENNEESLEPKPQSVPEPDPDPEPEPAPPPREPTPPPKEPAPPPREPTPPPSPPPPEMEDSLKQVDDVTADSEWSSSYGSDTSLGYKIEWTQTSGCWFAEKVWPEQDLSESASYISSDSDEDYNEGFAAATPPFRWVNRGGGWKKEFTTEDDLLEESSYESTDSEVE
jgi:hypothetical protein